MKFEPLESWPRPSPLEFCFLAVGLFFTIQYAWLLDDAYIYFRYVDNWLFLDRGLVFNPGEYAEGFTSPGWLFLMAALRFVGMDYWLAVRAVAVVSFLLLGCMAIAINRRLSPQGAPVLNLPLAILSTNYAVLCYFSSGTESPAVLLAAACFALFVLNPRGRWIAALVAISPMIRPELALPLLLGVVWARWRTGRTPWEMIAVAAVVNGSWLLFRIYYYADLFPTTYHLKNSFELVQGLHYVHDTLRPYHFYELALLGAVTIVALGRRRGDGLATRERAVMLGTAALIVAYVIKVGGDARHFRYLAFPACLSLLALSGVAELAWVQWGARIWRAVATVAVVVVAALSFSFHPRQLEKHPLVREQSKAVLVNLIADAAHHRHRPSTTPTKVWSRGGIVDMRPLYRQWRSDPTTVDPTGVLVDPLCWKQYQQFDFQVVHAYGLTDPILARVDLPWRRPGHKLGMKPLAEDLARVYRWWPRSPEPGMFRAASDAGVAASWIADNIETIEVIERKMYNRHRLVENLGLALTRLAPIDAGERRSLSK